MIYKSKVAFTYPELDKNGVWYINNKGIKKLFPKNIDWRTKGGIPPVRD